MSRPQETIRARTLHCSGITGMVYDFFFVKYRAVVILATARINRRAFWLGEFVASGLLKSYVCSAPRSAREETCGVVKKSTGTIKAVQSVKLDEYTLLL